MAILERKPDLRKPQIDLNSPQGNAFYILATAGKMADRLKLNKDEILNDMKSSDYEHLIQVFDKHFGDYIDLVR